LFLFPDMKRMLLWLGLVFNSGLVIDLKDMTRSDYLKSCLSLTNQSLAEIISKYNPNIGGELDDVFIVNQKPTTQQMTALQNSVKKIYMNASLSIETYFHNLHIENESESESDQGKLY
jgi:hypothetical protein